MMKDKVHYRLQKRLKEKVKADLKLGQLFLVLDDLELLEVDEIYMRYDTPRSEVFRLMGIAKKHHMQARELRADAMTYGENYGTENRRHDPP
jgi:hypothetical protein